MKKLLILFLLAHLANAQDTIFTSNKSIAVKILSITETGVEVKGKFKADEESTKIIPNTIIDSIYCNNVELIFRGIKINEQIGKLHKKTSAFNIALAAYLSNATPSKVESYRKNPDDVKKLLAKSQANFTASILAPVGISLATVLAMIATIDPKNPDSATTATTIGYIGGIASTGTFLITYISGHVQLAKARGMIE